jgi:hypothetical protein
MFLACTVGCTSLEVVVRDAEVGSAQYTPCDDLALTATEATRAVDAAKTFDDEDNTGEVDVLMLPWMDVIAGIVSGGAGLCTPGGDKTPPATGALLADIVLVRGL